MVSARGAIFSTSRSMMRMYSRRLKRARSNEPSDLERTGTETRQGLVEFFAGEAAVEIFLAQQRGQKIGVLEQRLAQVTAVAEDDYCVMGERVVLFDQTQDLRRGL